MNISAHLGALKVVTKIRIKRKPWFKWKMSFKRHSEIMCFIIVCHCYDLSVELQRHEKRVAPLAGMSLRQCGGTEIRDGNPVQNVCVCVLPQATAGQSLKT